MATKATAAEPLTVALTPAPEAGQAVTLLAEAKGLQIVDRVSHEAARQFLKGAKALKRTIEEHYAAIKKPLNAARQTVLDMERTHLAPVEEAIALAERVDTAYVREQQRLEQAEADRRRREAEAEEQKRRDDEAAKAEAEALKMEASSTLLSDRERVVVSLIVARLLAVNHASPDDWLRACKTAGYKDPKAAAERLIRSDKLGQPIADAVSAAAMRRESEAKKTAPIIVETQPVESQVAKVAGTSVRSYYGCGEVDLQTLARAVVEGVVPLEALQPNTVFLNQQARSLRETFPQVFPGCQLTKKDGVTA